MKLSKREKEAVIVELAKRVWDIAYMHATEEADKVAAPLLDRLEKEDGWNSGDEFVLTFQVKMVVGDLIQVIGRGRREKTKKEAKKDGSENIQI